MFGSNGKSLSKTHSLFCSLDVIMTWLFSSQSEFYDKQNYSNDIQKLKNINNFNSPNQYTQNEGFVNSISFNEFHNLVKFFFLSVW